jgi:signal transduction histidine kinase/ligand-binding sensor domain-containing protein
MLIPLVMFYCNPLPVFSQIVSDKHSPENFRLVNWNSDQGLYYGKVNCFLKDKNGFLWVGSDGGLNRFDGSLFKNYLNPSGGNHTTIGNYIISLNEDSLHNIWAGTDMGISRYDIRADSFTHFLVDNPHTAFDQTIISFWATADWVYCVESDTLITAYNTHTLQKKEICKLSRRLYWYSNALTVMEPDSNCIWMLPGTAEGGLLRVSLSDGKEQSYNPSFKEKNHWSESMCYDKKRNCIWINEMGGLVQFTLNDKQFHYIDRLKGIINRGASICLDRANRVWIGTGDKGLVIYDPQTGSVERPFETDAVLSRRANEFNYRIYCDRDGLVWIGYWIAAGKGINQLSPVLKSFRHYEGNTGKPNSLSSTYGNAIDSSTDGRIWIFVDPDLNIFNPATDSFQVIKTKDISGVGINKKIYYLGIGRSGQKAWILGEQTTELFEMDILSKRCRPFTIMDKDNHPIVHPGLMIQSGIKLNKGQDDLFIGGLPERKFGIYLLNKDSPVAHLIGEIDTDFDGWESDGDNRFFYKRHGEGHNLTYALVKGKLERVVNPTDSFEWNSIYLDPSDHSLWVGTFMELIHYDNHFNTIHRYTHSEGVPLTNVFGIHADKMGNIWFYTERSIARLDPKSGRIRTLSGPEGFQEQPYHSSPLAADDNGDLYFFGYQGLDRVKPDQVKDDYPPSLVYLKSLEINQAPVSIAAAADGEQERLDLKYFQNKISIETGIIDYYSKGLSKIRYKLDGVNKDWQYGPANYTIRYEELPPGEYRLVMAASNTVNTYNGKEKILYFNIHPPWWATWTARILFGIVFLGLVFGFVQYRSRNLRRRNVVLEDRVVNRTKELKHSLEELRETQTQLIHSEKMASLGELTAGIAHEIQNPLNFVNNFSELNTELIDELQTEIKSGNSDEALLISNGIRDNEQKISHHGKRADAIVKGMLQHSRTSTGVKEPTNINALADEYLRLSYRGMRAKDNSFTAMIETGFDETIGSISAIPQDIGRVLLNLYNNAFYAVYEKKKLLDGVFEPKVSVSSRQMEHKIEIIVKDNGNGMPKKIQDKIFQPFFTTKPTGQGTGLGLSLSYDIIKAHGGEIRVDSKEAEFTEFVVQIPIV